MLQIIIICSNSPVHYSIYIRHPVIRNVLRPATAFVVSGVRAYRRQYCISYYLHGLTQRRQYGRHFTGDICIAIFLYANNCFFLLKFHWDMLPIAILK